MELKNILQELWWIDKIAGTVWIVLSGILISILVRIYKNNGINNIEFKTGLGLLIFVWLYPIYTGFFRNMLIGEIGNIATLLFTLTFYIILRKNRKKLSKWIIPQTIWLSIATFYLGIQILNGV